ncbi:LuxR family maltose regulon positive regulatory protein [Streptomyces griseochromogenes]|uniref:Helix-turn-helix transcriptional regulator n=1 Tax=Streptomyces griseochromogenes TaxID=68214 RepID=A0A1B1AVH8_9ACTN|nr:LuxR C-terminal-related transcriptional regulator [Streptomyces griseochromogenes]ANP50547.1 helix-turn-helix transcriptional regulator [Streptomyces griseochromogenes]MBP2051314.1 LuxR family maltose regulon positive regulatory protein [Streptomyces griseochromogenes]
MATTDDDRRTGQAAYADPLGEPFLHTRFAPPARPATFLRRDRLLEHLDQAARTPLTMVNGSAGAGKTLLVADWAARLHRPVAWMTTEAEDDSSGVFWAHLLQALRATGAPLPDAIGCPADADRVDHGLLARLAAALSEAAGPLLVVLDEFDRVTAPQIAEELEFVLHHAADGMRLVLVTRTEPLLPLHRYRVAGAITEIRDAELAFTPEEASALLDLHGLHLPAEATRALVTRTRGWAAGLRLCALAARETEDPQTYLKEFEAARSTVADYLLAEVLKRQPARTQDLLLRVSVLERFRPELADALTGRGGSEPVLAGLHRQNAFVEDLGHRWYRLHPLFAEILRAHLRERSPELEPELHRRAAVWLRETGSLSETLAHGAAAGDWDLTAGALVDDLAIGQLFTGLRRDDLDGLFRSMGPEATGAAADLVRAARDLARCDLDHGLAHLRRAERTLADAAGDGSAAAARLSCALLDVLAARLSGSPGAAELVARTAEDLRGEVPEHLLRKHPELAALLLTHLGSARLWAGRLDAARAVLSAVADGPGTAATTLPREESLGHLALIDYLNGWPGRAERKARAALGDAERRLEPRPSGTGLGHTVLAAVAVDRDELAQARALLDEAAEICPAGRDPVATAGRALACARLLLARGDPQAAAAAAELSVAADAACPWAQAHTALIASAAHLAEGRPDSASKVLDDIPCDGRPYAAELAWAHLAAGNRDAALHTLDALHGHNGTGPAVAVRTALVRARAAHEAGDTDTARRLLARALLQARRDRLRRPFLDAGPQVRLLLETPPLDELAAGWLILPPGGKDAPGAAAPQVSPLVVEELSGRERDVLLRLSRMMSTEEIAADLTLSVNTVKTHLKSVYRKLAVNRRSDAVRRARELRLL